MHPADPFAELTKAEQLLEQSEPAHETELDYRQLKILLAQERVLDRCRMDMFDQHPHGSPEAEDYIFREYMVRHKISTFGLQLSKEVTDRLTGEDPVERSFVAMYVKNRDPYPKPVKKTAAARDITILALADRPPKIDIAEVVRANNVELIVTLGDLTREDLLQLERITDIPKIGVYGNHDSGTYMPELGIWDMHLKVWEYNGVRFGGFQGCVRYKESPDAIMYTQEEASQMMAEFPQVDVFICHCPPRGINDEAEIAHQGFDALRDYIEREPPKVLLHGHTYPTEETVVKQHGSTRIEYVFEHKLITL